MLAKKYLCVPASSAPSERVFSALKRVLDERFSLLPERLCAHTTYRCNWALYQSNSLGEVKEEYKYKYHARVSKDRD